MRLPFAKLHSRGNDFVLVDARGTDLDLTAYAAGIADRRLGIGADQLLVMVKGQRTELRMEIVNADGSVAEMCGNGIRAFAAYAWSRGVLPGGVATIETATGQHRVDLRDDGWVRAQLAVPRFGLDELDFDATAFGDDAQHLSRPSWPAPAEDGDGVSVGNPHVVFFLGDLRDTEGLADAAAAVQHDPAIRQGTNVEFVHVEGAQRVAVRVWERGVGETQACGSGACAAAVAAIRRGWVRSPVTVALPGGELEVAWNGTGEVALSGPTTEVAEGTIDLEAVPRATR